MRIEDVTVKARDQSGENSMLYYRSRVVEITTDKGTFTTPSRVVARTEYLARSGIPLYKNLPLDLAVDFRPLDNAQVDGLMNEGERAKKIVLLTKQFNDITANAIFRISIFQPSRKLLTAMSTPEKIRFADTQAEYLQIRLGTDLVTYPYLQLPISDYKSFIDSHTSTNGEFSTIFTLDMKMNMKDMKEVIDHIISKNQPTIIALIYEDWAETIPQHTLISSYFNQDKVAFFACQVEREQPESHTSNMHSVTFGGGFDLVALKQVRGYKKNPVLDLNKIRFFDPQTLSINNIESTLENPNRNIVNELSLQDDNARDYNYLGMILRGYRGALVHPKKFQVLYYLGRVHEALTSYTVFRNNRERIEHTRMLEHINETNLRLAPIIRRRRI